MILPEHIMESNSNKSKKIWKQVVSWGLLNLGTLLMACGVTFFEAPNHFALGGVSGISIALAPHLTKVVPWLTQPVILAIINVALLIIGLIVLGRELAFKTVYCSAMYSLEVYLLGMIPVKLPVTNQPLLELAFAVIILGIASALIFQCRASSGGSDIIGLIVKKFTRLNIGTALLAADFLIACLQFMTSTEAGMFSLLGVMAKTFVIDGVIDNMARTKCVTIITNNPEIVAKIIIEDIDRGFTKYKAEGGYTGEERTIIVTVCRRAQAMRLKEKLHQADPTAFTIITDANEILGNGFNEKI